MPSRNLNTTAILLASVVAGAAVVAVAFATRRGQARGGGTGGVAINSTIDFSTNNPITFPTSVTFPTTVTPPTPSLHPPSAFVFRVGYPNDNLTFNSYPGIDGSVQSIGLPTLFAGKFRFHIPVNPVPIETTFSYVPATTLSGGPFTIDWGDGSQTTTVSDLESDIYHDYPTDGEFVVVIAPLVDSPSASLNGWGFLNSEMLTVNKQHTPFYVRNVIQWGTFVKFSHSAFYNCMNMNPREDDAPRDQTPKFVEMPTGQDDKFGMAFFFAFSAFNQDIGGWDVSNVKSIAFCFCSSRFNRDIGMWNVGNVVSTWSAFANARQFNQNISLWNVSNVVDMRSMFESATLFNQDLSNWGTRALNANIQLNEMFGSAFAEWPGTLTGMSIENLKKFLDIFLLSNNNAINNKVFSARTAASPNESSPILATIDILRDRNWTIQIGSNF